jgi:peptidyl-prolyl cis-trans isomerase B (cyclophilin B)
VAFSRRNAAIKAHNASKSLRRLIERTLVCSKMEMLLQYRSVKASHFQAPLPFFVPLPLRPRSTLPKRYSSVCTSAQRPADANDPSRRCLLLAIGAVPTLLSSTPPVLADGSKPRAYFNFSVDGTPFGRVVVEVDPTFAPVGSRRFLDLAQGKEGVGYRRTRIDFLQDGYFSGNGPKALSFKASGRSPIAGGPTAEFLEDEMDASGRGMHDRPGTVSLVVRLANERTSKDKLVAVKGQLVTVTEVYGAAPNGAAFAITSREEPGLDATNLVIGRVVEGQAVVDKLVALPRVKDNSSSPFFQAGKKSGDGRARVAERAFNKPFNKIVIDECGLLSE